MAQQTDWRRVEEVQEEVVVDNGDIFAPLREIRHKYYQAAARLAAKVENDEYEEPLAPMYAYIKDLRDCGDRVGRLIPNEAVIQEAQSAEPVTSGDADTTSGGAQG